MAQIPDLESHYTDALRAQAESMKKERGLPTLGFYGQLMVYPELFQKVQELGTFLRFHSELSDRLRETAILVAAVELRSAFEWQTHQHTAASAGAALEQADPDLQVIVRAAIAQQSVPQDAFDRFSAAHGLKAAVEVVTLAAAYRMYASLAAAFDSTLPGAPPPPWS